MAFYGDSDIPAMHADAGVPVSFGLVHGFALWDISDDEMLALEASVVVGKTYRAQLHTNTFKGLKQGSILVVEEKDYRVTATRQINDGAELHAFCLPV